MRSRGAGIVSYNVQMAVDAEHHLIVAHEVTMTTSDRNQLSKMALKAAKVMDEEGLKVVADKGYYTGKEIKACEDNGITVYIPKVRTSNNKAKGLYDKSKFDYIADEDIYRCLAGEALIWRMTTVENGLNLHRYWSSNCQSCWLKSKCTPSPQRRVTRWEHEAVLEKVERRLNADSDKMRTRCETVEHPFGTLKHWMGATHFQMTTLKHVSTEMSLHVLAYNMTRVINILGVKALMDAINTVFLRYIDHFYLFYISFKSITMPLCGLLGENRGLRRIFYDTQ